MQICRENIFPWRFRAFQTRQRMHVKTTARLMGLLILATALAACSNATESEVMEVDAQPPASNSATANAPIAANAYANEELSPRVLRRFAPLDPAAAAVKGPLTDLGRELYYDPR